MTYGRSVSLRGPKFVEGMEFKGKRCDMRIADGRCKLTFGHSGPHSIRATDTGGRK